MNTSDLLHHLVHASAAGRGDAPAVTQAGQSVSYAQLAEQIDSFAAGLIALGTARSERVAVYLDKRIETVVALFGTSAAGAVFVPVNPVLKPEQVLHILRDCNVRVLVTTGQRYASLCTALATCDDLRHVIMVGSGARPSALDATPDILLHDWNDFLHAPLRPGHRVIDVDMAAILYTSGSTGRPKGVVLTHRNMVAGAKSVAAYLGNAAHDSLLAVLPLSFDAGFSQLSTAFCTGARVVLLNYLLPRDVLKAVVHERITGLTAVPPLWIQLAQLDWPGGVSEHLRYIASTGGRMPLETLERLRRRLPGVSPYLMYGLTEAFRATYLDPGEIERRPGSIGKAIPNAEVLVLRPDGTRCAPGEPGELVQRGALVASGYWNDQEATRERFRPLPPGIGTHHGGLPVPEIAVYSGDSVRADEEGFLYFIGRRDEMIKCSGYRVSPTEVEEILYTMPAVGECVAFGVPHPEMGQAICAIVTAAPGCTLEAAALHSECRTRMPGYMVPTHLELRTPPLARNPNGKIDRKLLSSQWCDPSIPRP